MAIPKFNQFDPNQPPEFVDQDAAVLEQPMVQPPALNGVQPGGGGGGGGAAAPPGPAAPPEAGGGITATSIFPPEQNKTVVSREKIVQSPGEIDAAKRELAAGKSLVDATKTEQEALAKSELAAAGAEKARADQAQKIEADRTAQLQAQQVQLQAAQQLAAQETAKAEAEVKRETAESGKTPFTGSIGGAIFAALINGASTRDAFILGKDPSEMPAVKSIDAWIQRDSAARLAKLALSKEFLAQKRLGPAAAQLAWQNGVDRINIQADARLKSALAQADVLKANGKVDKGRFDAIAQAAVARTEQAAATSAGNIAQRASTKQEVTRTDIEGAGLEKKPIVTKDDASEYTAMENDIARLEQLRTDIKSSPEDFKHVNTTRQKFTGKEKRRGILERIPAVGPITSLIENTFDPASQATDPSQLLDAQKHPRSPDIFTGVEEATAVKARSYGGVIQEGDRKAAEAASALASRGPKEYDTYLQLMIAQRKKAMKRLGDVKGMSPSAPDKPAQADVSPEVWDRRIAVAAKMAKAGDKQAAADLREMLKAKGKSN